VRDQLFSAVSRLDGGWQLVPGFPLLQGAFLQLTSKRFNLPRWCYENFLQFKSLGRVRDIRDQLAGLCERVEVVINSNPNPSDIVPIQKAIVSGYFYNTVRLRSQGRVSKEVAGD
jgi:hypothetical protein